jgi:hypothetical protein
MKKHLLAAVGLLSFTVALSQSSVKSIKASGIENSAQKIVEKFTRINQARENVSSSKENAQIADAPQEDTSPVNSRGNSVNTFTTGWRSFTGSMNAYGVLNSSQKPLQYNDELNTVSFIHRKSATYSMSPQSAIVGAQTGGIVAMVSKNWGTQWDSTLIWNNTINWARYPQGGIYNAPGNTIVDSTYIIGMGPVVTSAGNWSGNFFASKQLRAGNYNNIASALPNAQQFMPSTPPYGTLNKTDFAYYDFACTDDGTAHALGLIADNVNPTLSNYRGARVIKGTFNSGAFIWTGDSLIPDVSSANDGSKNLISLPFQAWNESGTVGYVFQLGCNKTNSATINANLGYQPIIFKTINSGQSWSSIPGIDFTQASFVAPVLDRLQGTSTNSNLTIPFFNFSEGISATVDKNNDLHIVTTLVPTSSSHPDSLGFTFRYNNADLETYRYPHVDGARPYIYDFIGGANPTASWRVLMVDSLLTESPGGTSTAAGYSSNLWAPDPTTGNKVESDARIQVSRTADGRFIVYTYADSDPSVTLLRWNSVPNVKARLLDVNTGLLHPTVINVTRPSAPSLRNTNVASRAYFHFASPKCAVAQTIAVGPNGPAIVLPMTVTNNTGLDDLAPVTHRYSSAALNFGNVAENNILLPGSDVGVKENSLTSLEASFLYPNPAKNNVALAIDLLNNSTVELTLSNVIGQTMRTIASQGQIGANTIEVDLNGLPKGIYLVQIKVQNVSRTKKLIIE